MRNGLLCLFFFLFLGCSAFGPAPAAPVDVVLKTTELQMYPDETCVFLGSQQVTSTSQANVYAQTLNMLDPDRNAFEVLSLEKTTAKYEALVVFFHCSVAEVVVVESSFLDKSAPTDEEWIVRYLQNIVRNPESLANIACTVNTDLPNGTRQRTCSFQLLNSFNELETVTRTFILGEYGVISGVRPPPDDSLLPTP